MIQCKRLYDAASTGDGYRVLVDRLWPRGVKKDALEYDEWCKTLTPSPALRKDFHSGALDFAAFREAWLAELAELTEEGERLLGQAKGRPLTLLYGAKDTQHNHAQVLAEWLRGLAIRP